MQKYCFVYRYERDDEWEPNIKLVNVLAENSFSAWYKIKKKFPSIEICFDSTFEICTEDGCYLLNGFNEDKDSLGQEVTEIIYVE